MPNYWGSTAPEIVKAEPYPVQGYGYLYIFHCVRHLENRDVPFTQMSQIFKPTKISFGPNNIYAHFKAMSNREGIPTITSLNKKEGRGEEWAVQKAVEYADAKKAEKQKIQEIAEKKLEMGEPVDRDVASDRLQKQIDQWDKEAKKANWYNKAKSFVRTVIAKKKSD